MSRLGVGLLSAYVVLGSACSDSVGPALEGLVMEGRPVEPARESHPCADTLSVSGGQPPYEWDVFPGGSLPPGLSLSTEGVISGIPELRGTWSFTVRARSADDKGALETLFLTVWPERAPVLEPTESCSDYPGWAVATFEDPRLEEAIGGPSSCEELAEVLVLTLYTGDTIASLVGLQNLPALAHLGLYSTVEHPVGASKPPDEGSRQRGPVGYLKPPPRSLRMPLNASLLMGVDAPRPRS